MPTKKRTSKRKPRGTKVSAKRPKVSAKRPTVSAKRPTVSNKKKLKNLYGKIDNNLLKIQKIEQEMNEKNYPEHSNENVKMYEKYNSNLDKMVGLLELLKEYEPEQPRVRHNNVPLPSNHLDMYNSTPTHMEQPRTSCQRYHLMM